MEHVQSTREMFLIEHLGILLEVRKTGVGVELEIRETVRELHGNLFNTAEPDDECGDKAMIGDLIERKDGIRVRVKRIDENGVYLWEYGEDRPGYFTKHGDYEVVHFSDKKNCECGDEPVSDSDSQHPPSASELVDMLLQCEGVHQYTRALLD